jgi:uncharacterized membrane protein YdjX (TVP38/TMEM64 family)
MSPIADQDVDPRRRLVTLGFALVAVALAAVFVLGPIREDLVEVVDGFGPVAPLAFVALYAILSLALVPGSFMTITAGLLFGPLLGTLLAVAGGALGATGAFLVGRWLGRSQVERLAGERLRGLDRWLANHGVGTIALVRIIPGVPYSLLNYVAGVTGISTRDYVLGTVVGLVPGAFVYATFGGTVDAPASPAFAGAILGLVLFFAAGTAAERWLRTRDA